MYEVIVDFQGDREEYYFSNLYDAEDFADSKKTSGGSVTVIMSAEDRSWTDADPDDIGKESNEYLEREREQNYV